MDTKRKKDLTEEELAQVCREMESVPATPVVKEETEKFEKKRKILNKRVIIILAVLLLAGLLIWAGVYYTQILKITNHSNNMANRNNTVMALKGLHSVVVICDDGTVRERKAGDANVWWRHEFEGEARSLAYNVWFKNVERFAILRADGTVTFPGEAQGEWEQWSDIKMLEMGNGFVLGLHENGKVFTVGESLYGACAVEDWTNIIGIHTAEYYSAGLRMDGTVVVTEVSFSENVDDPCMSDFGSKMNEWLQEASKWRNIVAITGSQNCLVGLKADGTVTGVCHPAVKNNWDFNFDDWTNIVDIDAGGESCVGVRGDGTVMLEGLFCGLQEEKLQELTEGMFIVDVEVAPVTLFLLTDNGTLYEVSGSEDWTQWTIEKVIDNVKLPN